MHRFPLTIALLLVASWGVVPSARAAFWEHTPSARNPLFHGWSVGVFGGVETWTLGAMEDVLAVRARDLSTQDFRLQEDSFGWRPAFGVELAYHFSEVWLVRANLEWARFGVEDRDGDSLPQLGGGFRFVSVGYKTTVESRYFLATLGAQRVHPLGGLVLSWGGGVVLAPIRVEDEVDNWLEGETSAATQKVTSSGFGVGLDLTATLDYLMESNSSIFVDLFFRLGSTTVEVDQSEWDNSFTPGKRDVEFTGLGLRLGVRFN